MTESNNINRGIQNRLYMLEDCGQVYKTLVDFCPSIIYVLDTGGNLAFLGGAFKKLTGFESQKFKGKPFINLVWEEDRKKLDWSFPLSTKDDRSIRTTRLRLRTKGAEGYKHFELSYSNVDLRLFGMVQDSRTGRAQGFIGICGVGIDVTESELARETMAKANRKLLKQRDEYRGLCHRVIDWVENERKQLSSIVFEDLLQGLGRLKMDFESLRQRLELAQPEVREAMKRAIKITAEQMGRIKSRVDVVTPRILDALGLVPAIAQLAERAKREKGFEIYLFAKDIPDSVSWAKRVSLYRIAEEAIHNATRHSRGKELFINIIGREATIVLTVEDDGCGFDYERLVGLPTHTVGLVLMREWAAKVGGKFSIDAKPGKGTQVWVEIPV